VALDRYSALLWIHGVAAALNPQRNYFQGKRRIPSPVLVHGKVESGLYNNASEVIREGLRLLRRARAEKPAVRLWLASNLNSAPRELPL
jgi:putative addiction module CopG family antidote